MTDKSPSPTRNRYKYRQVDKGRDTVPEEDSNSDEEEEVLPQISHLDASNALQTVHLYEEQQQEGLQEVIQALNHLGMIRHLGLFHYIIYYLLPLMNTLL